MGLINTTTIVRGKRSTKGRLPQSASQRPNENKHSQAILAFCLGLGSLLQIHLVGYMAMSEVVFAILGPLYVAIYWRQLLRTGLMPFLWLTVGWFASAVATDLYRLTARSDMLRGIGMIPLWAFGLVCMFLILRKDPASIKWFVLGAAVSATVAIRFFRPGTVIALSEFAGEDPTAFKTVYAGVLLAWLFASSVWLFPRFPRLAIGILLIAGAYYLLKGSRNIGGQCILAGIMAFVLLQSGHRIRPRTAFLLACVAGMFLVAGYRFAAMNNLLGQEEQDRYLKQSATKVGILGGRGEFASALFAVRDSPFLGHGSWARDVDGYFIKGSDLIGAELPKSVQQTNDQMLIPTHSHIWGAWVWHGILGAIFWIYTFFFVVRFFTGAIVSQSTYLLFLLLVIFQFAWDILFSPFGARPVAAAYLMFLVVLNEKPQGPWRFREKHRWRTIPRPIPNREGFSIHNRGKVGK